MSTDYVNTSETDGLVFRLWIIAWQRPVVGGVLLGSCAGRRGGGELAFTFFFPWSHFLYRTSLLADQFWVLKLMSFLQLPWYGIALGAFWQTTKPVVLITVLSAFHLVAAGACFLPLAFYASF